MKDKPLCCMMKGATDEDIYHIKELLRTNPACIIHDERLYFYYPEEMTEQEAEKRAEDILKNRFAKGEISSEEYTERMARL